MHYLTIQDPEIKPDVRSVDRTDALNQRRVSAFATKAAQFELGRAYVPPAHEGFRDLTPDQIRAARQSLWVLRR